MPQVLSTRTDTSQLINEVENFLAEKEGSLRMNIPNQQLIDEAFGVNHRQVKDEKTRNKYREHLKHFSEYLSSSSGLNFYTAQRKHVQMFMTHLEEHGGETPHHSRVRCSWCAAHGYPDGRDGRGWSASTRKGYLSAIRFLYEHFSLEEDLPSIDPSRTIKSPRVVQKYAYIPGTDEMRKFLAVKGSRNETLIAYWMAYAPERRGAFREARWRDIDLQEGHWHVFNAKGGRSHVVSLHTELVRRLRQHLDYQVREAGSDRRMKMALEDEGTAFVLLSNTGRQLHPSTLTKLIKQRGVRAKVGLVAAKGQSGSVGGMNSKMTPHALRRAWASSALNDEIAIDVVAEALGHKDITTTRRHYARTEPGRVKAALLGRSY